jgi:large subunit ribosomal protein L29
MKAADLREKSAEDLRELAKTLARDVFQNRLKNFTNRLDDTSAIRKTRRDLARVITLLRERELAGTPAEASSAPAPAHPPAEGPSDAKPARAKKTTRRAEASAKPADESAPAEPKAKKKSAAKSKATAKKDEAK